MHLSGPVVKLLPIQAETARAAGNISVGKSHPFGPGLGKERQIMTEQVGRKKYVVRLTDEERSELQAIRDGTAAAYRRRHANILLLADVSRKNGGYTDAAIADVLGIGTATAERIRKRCVMEGIEAALGRKQQLNRKARKLDGDAEARLVALACSEPPEGHARWTLSLLRDELVVLSVVDSISKETVRRALKKTL